MYLGLDIGGTHTDAVIISGSKVIRRYKTVTDHDNLARSVISALEKVSEGLDKKGIKQINLSTTLSTNAIIENRISPVGVIVSAGPGINPINYSAGPDFHVVSAVIDHRGEEQAPPDLKELEEAAKSFHRKKIKYYAVVGKFSTRNPGHEDFISEKIAPMSVFTTRGHKLSGRLNFPRRIYTAYYNSAVHEIYGSFSDAVKKGIEKIGLECPVYVLKADGGTMPFEISRSFPVESIMSGPAASIMGILALCDIREDAIILDIGGTTTDIAVFSGGVPLLEKDGISINGLPTLVKSLLSRSIGIGGDSSVSVSGSDVTVGSGGRVKSLADGGSRAALIDLMNRAGLSSYGDTVSSSKGVDRLAADSGLGADKICSDGVNSALDRIINEYTRLLEEINSKPVYTIHEMVEGKKISPRKIYLMGGPAEVFAPLLRERSGMEIVVPPDYGVANAIGAALAKVTFEIELFADTSRGVISVPNVDVSKASPPGYSLKSAEKDAVDILRTFLNSRGIRCETADIEIIESSSFRMIGGWTSSGDDIRVRCQVKPGVSFRVSGGSAL